MKYFNRSALKNAKEIPNIGLHDDVYLEHLWVTGYGDRDYRICEIIDNESDEAIISWYTDHENNPTHTHFTIKSIFFISLINSIVPFYCSTFCKYFAFFFMMSFTF